MSYENNISPTREYEVTMAAHQDNTDRIVELVTLPDGLVNTRFIAQVYWQKYVPEGYAIVDAQPFVEGEEIRDEAFVSLTPVKEEPNPQYAGIGNELDYVGPEEDPDGFTIHEIDDTEEAPEDEEASV